jgi:galactokinase
MPETAVGDAPGRANLMGDHTDYHEGFVLPTLIPQLTRVTLRRRRDNNVSAISDAAGAGRYELGRESKRGGWIDYLQGATEAFAKRGIPLTGFDAQLASDIPIGAGVSSSAALTVAFLRALRELFNATLDDVELAVVARSVETDFVGAPVGIMDPMACSVGHRGEALFIDTRTLATERVPLPATVQFAVIDSGVAHRHAGGGYVTRRKESFAAAAALGVDHLRDVRVDDLCRLAALPPLLARRARHVVTENQRVVDAVAALRSGDGDRLGALFTASHRSLRDDYQVSTPDVDRLVEIAEHRPAVFGARLTGGGFGGAIVVAMRPGSAQTANDIVTEYATTGGRGSLLTIIAAA